MEDGRRCSGSVGVYGYCGLRLCIEVSLAGWINRGREGCHRHTAGVKYYSPVLFVL